MILLTYDISLDNFRRQISDLSQKYGLYRIQKSVFMGDIVKADELNNLANEIKNIIGESESDSIYIFEIPYFNIKNNISIGKDFNRDLILEEKRVLIL